MSAVRSRWTPQRRGPLRTPAPDPVRAWTTLIEACAALDRHGDQPGRLSALSDARPACLAAPFPVAGEAAAATAQALLHLAQTYARCPEAHRDWRRQTLGALAEEAGAILQQMLFARAAGGRAASGAD